METDSDHPTEETEFWSSSSEEEESWTSKRELSFAFYPWHSKRPKKAEKPIMKWSYEDQSALLKGIFEYQQAKGLYPTEDSRGFYDFVRGSLHLEFNRSQVITKVRALKNRYTGANWPYKGFKRLVIPHACLDQYEMAKKIWGKDVDDKIIYLDLNSEVHYVTMSNPEAARRFFDSCNSKKPCSLKREQGVNCEIKEDGVKKPKMVWSYEDKVALLKGIIEYRDAKGVYPTKDPDGFHGFAKGSLRLEFSRKQVIAKVGTQKDWYTGGNLPYKDFKRLVLRRGSAVAFQLARKIWGKDVRDAIYIDANGIIHDRIASQTGKATKGYCHRCTHYLPSSARIEDFDSYFGKND